MQSAIQRPITTPLWLPTDAISDGWELLGVSRLSAAAASVSFSFPTDYRMLWLIAQIIKDGTQGQVFLRLNGDSTSTSYAAQRLNGYSTTVDSGRVTGQNQIDLTNGSDQMENAAGLYSVFVVKQLAGEEALVSADAATTWGGTVDAVVSLHTAGIWANTAELISSLSLVPSATNFAADSTFLLLGTR